MNDTRVTVLTPAGSGAVATVAVVGPRAWEVVRSSFKPRRGDLPNAPPLHRVYSGVLGEGGDEVVVGVRQTDPEPWVEVHCHGGRRVVRWVVDQLTAVSRVSLASAPESVALASDPQRTGFADPRAHLPLTHAATLKVASILLDQLNGAFLRAVEGILADFPNTQPQLQRLAALAPVGRRLTTPARIVIAGPPNVGKSSLLNALAGYQRSIVSPTAGTTRDVVGVDLAFDGWPVRVSDTAGLRTADEQLEAAGIELAERELATADLIVWVLDNTSSDPEFPPGHIWSRLLFVVNKCDEACAWASPRDASRRLNVSATSGTGVPQLVGEIVRRLFPVVPQPGEAVPFTPELCDSVEQAETGDVSALASRGPRGPG